MLRYKTLVILICLFVCGQAFAAGEKFLGSFTTRKQGGKEQSKWTIVDFLAQKKKIQLMDMWLAMNTSASMFEFSLGGGPVSYDYTTRTNGSVTTTHQTSQRYHMNGYVSIFGIEAEYEDTNQKLRNYSAAIGIRLLGNSNQTTRLTAKYGIQKRVDESASPEEIWQNQFAEGSLQLYVIDFFGLHGDYRYYFPDKSTSGNDLSGTKATAGAFIEIGMFRIYGDGFQEKMKYKTSTTTTDRDRVGYEYGVQLYL